MSTLHVSRLNELTDVLAKQLTEMAGFSGQDTTIKRRWQEPVDSHNHMDCAEVEVLCDSGD